MKLKCQKEGTKNNMTGKIVSNTKNPSCKLANRIITLCLNCACSLQKQDLLSDPIFLPSIFSHSKLSIRQKIIYSVGLNSQHSVPPPTKKDYISPQQQSQMFHIHPLSYAHPSHPKPGRKKINQSRSVHPCIISYGSITTENINCTQPMPPWAKLSFQIL